MRALARELRLALRRMRRAGGSSAVILLTLAIGIGAGVTLFSQVDAIAFRPLAIRRPESLVAVYTTRGDDRLRDLSYPDFRRLEGGTNVFSGAAAFIEAPVALQGPEGAELVWSYLVSPGYFRLLGLEPAAGRMIGRGDDRAVVLSYRYWQRRFAGDPQIVGRSLELNGHPFVVAGVAPASFLTTRNFSYSPALWAPVAAHADLVPGSRGLLESHTRRSFQVVARLRPGVGIAQARAATGALLSASATTPETRRGELEAALFSNRTPVNPWVDRHGELRRMGTLVLAGAALLLLVASTNAANLLLTRIADRRRELALTQALGARSRRIVSAVLCESLLLAVGAGLGGILLAWGGNRMASHLLPTLDFAPAVAPRLDGRVLLFALAVCLATCLLAGLAPALEAARVAPAPILRGSGRGVAPARSRLRDVSVAVQVAVSLLVLFAAGLFVRSLVGAVRIDPGLRLDGAAVFTIDPSLSGFDAEGTRRLYDELERRLAALPGVAAVGRASNLPLDGSSSGTTVLPEGDDAASRLPVLYAAVDRGYFAAVGTPIVSGREFVAGDRERAVEPVVINREAARRLWPGEDPLGRRLRLGSEDGSLVEVVGVTPTGRYRTLGEPPQPFVFFTLEREPESRTTLVVRAGSATAGLFPAIRRIASELAPGLPVTRLQTLRAHTENALSGALSAAWVTGTIGLLALLLASAGLYAMLTYAVSRRTRELGIRAALGASPSRLWWVVARRAAWVVGAGLVAGILAACAVGRLLVGYLYGVGSVDPWSLAGAVGLLGAVALLAASLPVRAASRVDPALVLRGE